MQGKGLILADSHAHLEMRDFDRDRDEVVKRAEDAGVALIVTVGTTLDDCRKAVSIAGKYEGIYAAVGIHPHDVKDIGNGTYDSLKKLAKMDKVVAFGEIGLDFFRNLSPRETQIMRFEEQLEVAAPLPTSHLPMLQYVYPMPLLQHTIYVLGDVNRRKNQALMQWT